MECTGSDDRLQAEPAPKRRKVRNGTQSCWECKRSKIRCTFSASADVCNSCRRRGTRCVSQQFTDESSSARNIEDRLGRVEAILEQIANIAGLSDESRDLPRRIPGRTASLITERAQAAATLTSSQEETPRHLTLHSRLVAAWPTHRELDIIWSLPVNISWVLECSICMFDSGSTG